MCRYVWGRGLGMDGEKVRRFQTEERVQLRKTKGKTGGGNGVGTRGGEGLWRN